MLQNGRELTKDVKV